MYALERNTPRCRIYWLDGEKFKTNLYVLFFDLPLKRETATKTALLAEVLKQGCKEYPTPRALAVATESLYGAIWDVSIVKKGDHQLLLFSLETVKAVEVEQALAFLKSLVAAPLLQDQGFVGEIVERQKERVRRNLAARRDDKGSYGRQRCLEETAKDTPLGILAEGYAEDLDGITKENLYAHYEKILNTAMVKVFFCGDQGEKKKITSLRKLFSGGEPVARLSPGEIRSFHQPTFVAEHMEMSQARLLMAFDTGAVYGKKSYATLLVLNQLFGGDADSLLFQNLREREGLCYDVKSSGYPMTGLLFVQMGIRGVDAKKAAVGVLKALEEIGNQGGTLKKLGQAQEGLMRDYETMADAPWRMVDFSVEQVLGGCTKGIEPLMRQIQNVTWEEVGRMANRAGLRTIYLLKGEEVQGHGKEI